MFKVRWTAEAEEDFEHIVLYYLENAGLQVAESI
jgi:plasmid stabilization system protein ParE